MGLHAYLRARARSAAAACDASSKRRGADGRTLWDDVGRRRVARSCVRLTQARCASWRARLRSSRRSCARAGPRSTPRFHTGHTAATHTRLSTSRRVLGNPQNDVFTIVFGFSSMCQDTSEDPSSGFWLWTQLCQFRDFFSLRGRILGRSAGRRRRPFLTRLHLPLRGAGVAMEPGMER